MINLSGGGVTRSRLSQVVDRGSMFSGVKMGLPQMGTKAGCNKTCNRLQQLWFCLQQLGVFRGDLLQGCNKAFHR